MKLVTVGVVLLAIVRVAAADAKPCGKGRVLDLERGACRAKPKAKKLARAFEKGDGDHFAEACKDDLGAACTQLAFMTLHGRDGIPRDPARALELYEKACKLDDADGCLGAARVYGSGLAGTADHSKAVPLLDQACTKKSGRACRELADEYAFGLGVAADADRATALQKQAAPLLSAECDAGDGNSCDLLGLMYRDATGGLAYDLSRALALFDSGCTDGSGAACYDFGYVRDPDAPLHLEGRDAYLDAPKAYALYVDACKRFDHLDGCFRAGRMLALDQVAGDLTQLPSMARRACELSEYGCDLLAFIEWYGKGTAVDYVDSLHWYEVSCQAGNPLGCYNAARMYDAGEGTSVDVKKAVVLYEKACDLSEGSSCAYAGQKKWWGDGAHGILTDRKRAFELFHQGCIASDHESCEWAGELLKEGTDGTGTPDPQRAVLYFQAGCDLGRGQSCEWAGELYYDGRATGTRDPATAIGFYERACSSWVVASSYGCSKVVELRRAGTEVDKDLLGAARAQIAICRIDGGDACITADTYLREAGADDSAKQELLATMQAACVDGGEVTCIAWAMLLRDGGYATGQDSDGSGRMLDVACDRGNMDGCWMRGLAYEATDQGKAKSMYLRACNGDHSAACVSLASVLEPTEAYDLYQRMCAQGKGAGCNGAGWAHYTGQGAAWDVNAADELYEKGCELGDAIACSNLGYDFEDGIARKADVEQAYTFFQKGCDLGYQTACGQAAWYIERGVGGAAPDAARAERMYQSACDVDGSPEACRRLADLKKDAALYQKAFNRAKELGADNPYYLWLLGTFHRDGIATTADAAAALKLFTEACDGNDPLGCLDGGRLAMATDPATAAVQLDKACAAAIEEACTLAGQARSAPALPATVHKKEGCCAAGADPGGAAALVLLCAATLRRRRAASARTPRRRAPTA